MKNIKTFMDFTCPFCYIGFSILDRLRKEEPDTNYTWYPYQLDEDTPIEGVDNLEKYGKEYIEESYERIENLGKEYDLHYNNKGMSYNTTLVHKAALFARDEGKLYEFAKEAFDTAFEKAENIGTMETVNDIGLRVGLNIAEMNRCINSGAYDEEMEEAKRLASVYEVESVPTFVVNDKKNVTDLKEYNEFKKDLQA